MCSPPKLSMFLNTPINTNYSTSNFTNYTHPNIPGRYPLGVDLLDEMVDTIPNGSLATEREAFLIALEEVNRDTYQAII